MSKTKLTWAVAIIVFLFAQLGLASHLKAQRNEMGADIVVEKGNMDPVEFMGTMVLSSFRGVIVDFLWVHTRSDEIKENVEQLPIIYDLITSLQPTFLESSRFAASNLAMDISAKFHTSDEKWEWINHALKLCDKSIARNKNHPKGWKMIREKGFIITQKCLPNSEYTGEHGAACYELFKKTYNREPHEVAIELYRQVLDYKKVPGLYLKDYEYAYEKWAHALDDPDKQAAKMRKAREAWLETVKKVNIHDTYSERLNSKVEMSEKYAAHKKKPTPESKELWMRACVDLAYHMNNDPLMVKQTQGEVAPNGINFYADVVLRLAANYDQQHNYPGVRQVGTTLLELRYIDEAVKWEESQFAIYHVLARSNDMLHGSTSAYVKRNAEFLKRTGNEGQRLSLQKKVDSYKRIALSYYAQMLEILKSKPDCFKGYLPDLNTGPMSVIALEKKIKLFTGAK